MEKPKEHNLRNIQEIFEAKTGVELRKKRHFAAGNLLGALA